MSTICMKLSCIETSEIVGNDVYASSFLTIFRPHVERSGTDPSFIFHCSIFSPQMQGVSCIWVIFLSVAKSAFEQSEQELFARIVIWKRILQAAGK